MVLQSIINERVDIALETVDEKTILISMAVTNPLAGLHEGLAGCAAALPVRDAYALYKSLGKMLGITPV